MTEIEISDICADCEVQPDKRNCKGCMDQMERNAELTAEVFAEQIIREG